jgi:dihydrofolate synthase/folylpolyglutamate synthase
VTAPARFDARGWLSTHVNLEAGIGVPSGRERGAPTLERISTLLTYLGSPETEFPAIHVTGTNGKTSTARILVQLLMSLGLKVGAYTSPHLEQVNERMTIDGHLIDDDELDEMLFAVSLVEEAMNIDPSYFEILTGAAFRWFADEAIDIAVVEVGLGGTWDATNVIDSRVSVITNVSVDHVEFLGAAREQIATEKAGIVKPDSALVLGETDPALQEIFVARGPRAVVRRDVDFGVRKNVLAVGGRFIDLYAHDAEYPDLFLPLHGAHQADNAAIAVAAACEFVDVALPHDVVEDALRTVQTPGRLEVVGRQPLVLLDGAHNVAGAIALRLALAEEFDDGVRTLVVGLLREKDPREMLTALGVEDLADVERGGILVVCRPPSPRALAPALVAQAAVELGVPVDRIEMVDSVANAVSTALLATPTDGQIVVTGSLYLVGAARSVLVRADRA